MKYVNMLNKISSRMQNSKRKNWIVIGDNSSGKSDLLKKLVEEIKGSVYYIDTVNRYFDVKLVDLNDKVIQPSTTSKEIINRRVGSSYYNLKDSFGKDEHIERAYNIYKERLKHLMEEFLNIEFSIEKNSLGELGEYNILDDTSAVVKINGQMIELSSGYQALVRLFAELIFYTEALKGEGYIIIDEVDEFLSPKYSGEILNFLVERFSNNNFIVSTHSSDLIANSYDCNVVALGHNSFSVVDSNDFVSLTEANMLFDKVLDDVKEQKEDKNDQVLQRLFDLKITGNWTQEEDNEFGEIKVEGLTAIQKVIYRQIEGWNMHE